MLSEGREGQTETSYGMIRVVRKRGKTTAKAKPTSLTLSCCSRFVSSSSEVVILSDLQAPNSGAFSGRQVSDLLRVFSEDKKTRTTRRVETEHFLCHSPFALDEYTLLSSRFIPIRLFDCLCSESSTSLRYLSTASLSQTKPTSFSLQFTRIPSISRAVYLFPSSPFTLRSYRLPELPSTLNLKSKTHLSTTRLR